MKFFKQKAISSHEENHIFLIVPLPLSILSRRSRRCRPQPLPQPPSLPPFPRAAQSRYVLGYTKGYLYMTQARRGVECTQKRHKKGGCLDMMVTRGSHKILLFGQHNSKIKFFQRVKRSRPQNAKVEHTDLKYLS